MASSRKQLTMLGALLTGRISVKGAAFVKGRRRAVQSKPIAAELSASHAPLQGQGQGIPQSNE